MPDHPKTSRLPAQKKPSDDFADESFKGTRGEGTMAGQRASALHPEMEEELYRRLSEFPQELLSNRSVNALGLGIRCVYLGDLVQQSDAALKTVRQLGANSLEEIKTFLGFLGLSLEMELSTHVKDNLEKLPREAIFHRINGTR